VTLSFVDKRQFLTVIQPVLPLHECADPAPTEFVAPIESTTPAEFAAAVEYAAEPLNSAAGAAPTETS
jgi:hypothetical protein